MDNVSRFIIWNWGMRISLMWCILILCELILLMYGGGVIINGKVGMWLWLWYVNWYFGDVIRFLRWERMVMLCIWLCVWVGLLCDDCWWVCVGGFYFVWVWYILLCDWVVCDWWLYWLFLMDWVDVWVWNVMMCRCLCEVLVCCVYIYCCVVL